MRVEEHANGVMISQGSQSMFLNHNQFEDLKKEIENLEERPDSE